MLDEEDKQNDLQQQIINATKLRIASEDPAQQIIQSLDEESLGEREDDIEIRLN